MTIRNLQRASIEIYGNVTREYRLERVYRVTRVTREARRESDQEIRSAVRECNLGSFGGAR